MVQIQRIVRVILSFFFHQEPLSISKNIIFRLLRNFLPDSFSFFYFFSLLYFADIFGVAAGFFCSSLGEKVLCDPNCWLLTCSYWCRGGCCKVCQDLTVSFSFLFSLICQQVKALAKLFWQEALPTVIFNRFSFKARFDVSKF